MKTTRKILLAVGIVAVIVGIGLYFLFTNLDRIVAAAIEKYGSEATGTKVAVSSVRLKLKAGEGSIRNLSVGNPRGFSTPSAFTLENITVAVDTGSVRKDPVVIDRVLVSAPRITYEIDESGKSNINVIRNKVERAEERGSSRKRGKTEKEKKIIIRRLVIENGEVTIKVAALPGKPLTAALPRIELSNLGGKGGDSPRAIATQIVGPLVNQAAAAASRAGIGQYLGKGADEVKKALEGKAAEKLGETGKEAAKGAEEAVKKLFGK